MLCRLTGLILAWALTSSLSAADQKTAAPWSLEPLREVAPPPLDSVWGRTPIDGFIFAKLREAGLPPSAEADRRTLVRRLSFDLHGLPPEPQEIDRFLADLAPGAWDRIVDRFLESPRYGERWGRHWLDVVHYGETHGYDKDKRRPNAWPYRDYLIRALNEDKSWGRMIEEQIAGDVLHPDDPDGIVALGFISAGPWDFVGHVELREGTVDKAITRSNDRDDMVAAVASSFLSLTVHCARCHDHKFDPITQDDYYGLQAVFAGVERADRPYDVDPAVHRRRRALEGATSRLREQLRATTERVAALGDAALKILRDRRDGLARDVASLREEARRGADSPTNGYHSAIMGNANATKWVQVDLGDVVSLEKVRIVPARPTDFPDTPGFGFPLRFRVESAEGAEFREPLVIADYAAADFPFLGDQPLEIPCNGRRARFVRVTAVKLWERTQDYVFALGELELLSSGKNVARGRSIEALDSIESGRWSKSALVDGFSSRRRLEAAVTPSDLEARIRERSAVLETSHKDVRAREDALLGDAEARSRADLEANLRGLENEQAQLPGVSYVFAAASEFAAQGSFTQSAKPREVQVLARGDVKNPLRTAVPGALACVQGIGDAFQIVDASREGERRAALARWIAAPRNPLTWRSIVNRVWQHHFGRGLVETPSDFGRMGAAPTHPELLDWLALRFVEGGGSLKKLHRLILSSAVWRQSSVPSAEAMRADADNRLLSRWSRSKLEAEAVRDAVLAVSGELDLAVGGPSVDHFAFKDDHSPIYDYARFDPDGRGARRRSIYRTIVRSVPDPFFECLDAADPSILTPRRNATLTALQALTLLNSSFVLKRAEAFAGRLRAETASPEAQVRLAIERALGRAAGVEEIALFAAHIQRFGLENVCRLLFNASEFVFVD